MLTESIVARQNASATARTSSRLRQSIHRRRSFRRDLLLEERRPVRPSARRAEPLDVRRRGLQFPEGRRLAHRDHRRRGEPDEGQHSHRELKIDPNDADPLAGEALCYTDERFFFANPETDYDAKVIGQADRAIALAPDTMSARMWRRVGTSYYRAALMRLSARPTPASPSIRIMPGCMESEVAPNLLLASSNKPSPMRNKRCG